MPQLDVIQPSFAAGEVTQALQSREDLAKQQVALKTCKNAIITSTGSIINRAGTEMVAECDDSTVQNRLLPFVFSTEQAYALCLGDNTMSVVKDGVLSLLSLRSATYKWTASGSGTDEYYLEIAAGGDPGIVEPGRLIENGRRMTIGTVGSLTVSTWDWGDNDTLGYNTVYVRLYGGTDPDSHAAGYVQSVLLFATPYSAGSENSALDYAQSADVMYLATPDYKPYKITRTSDTAWTVTAISFQDGPYRARVDGDEDITFTPAAKTGSGIVVEVSESINWPAVGDAFRIGYENPLDQSIIDWGWGTIAAVTDADTFTINIQKDLGYEYLLNPEFKDGLAFWEDRSTGVSSTSYSATSNVAQLNQGASGVAYLAQTLTVNTYELLTIEVVVDTIGGGGNLLLTVGTTALGAQVLASKTISAPGTYSYTTLIAQPTASTIYLTLATSAGTPDYTHEVSRVSVMRQDLSSIHWRRAAWNADLGWPEHVAIFEQAVFYANNVDKPDTFWKTKTGEYEKFTFNTPALDTDGIGVTLASNQVNAIQWMQPFLEMVMGTTSDEWKVQGGANSSVITPTSIDAKSKSKTGSASVKPIIAGNSLLFLNRNANKVYVLTYSFDADGYKPQDITVLAPHLLDGYTITEWAYQEDPHSVVWAVRSDGKLLGLTYIPEQDIWAWQLHETEGLFESVTVIPESGIDTVYFIVKRIIGGGRLVRRFIEKLKPRIADEDIYDWYMVDSGVTLDIQTGITKDLDVTAVVFTSWDDDGTTRWKVWITYTDSVTWATNGNDYIYVSGIVGTTELNNKTFRAAEHQVNPWGAGSTFVLKDREGDDYIDGNKYAAWVSGGEVRRGITEITGFEHLNGETLNVLADGSSFTKLVAPLDESPTTKWGFTLDDAAIVVHAGMPYTTEIETLPHEMILSGTSTTQGKLKRVQEVTLSLYKSRYANIGTSADNMKEMNFNKESSGNNPPPLFTGTKKSGTITESPKLSTTTFIRNDKGLPLEVAGIISKVDFNEL
jgi:hypothetical protein